MLTDGQVHDIPANAAALPKAPLHALFSGHDDERDRRIVIDAGAALRHRRRAADDPLPGDRRRRGATIRPSVKVTITRDGDPLRRRQWCRERASDLTVDVPHGGLNLIEFEAEPLAGELTRSTTARAVEIEGIRENLRVLLVSGEPHPGERAWRNLLKSDASRRSRAFHDSEPAGKAGRHADPRIVAHRLSDARAVLAKDQPIRSHHLRSLCAGRRAAACSISTISPSTSRWRRAAGRFGAGLRRCSRASIDSPLSNGVAGARRRPDYRAAVLPGGDRRRRAPPGDARPRRQR